MSPFGSHGSPLVIIKWTLTVRACHPVKALMLQMLILMDAIRYISLMTVNLNRSGRGWRSLAAMPTDHTIPHASSSGSLDGTGQQSKAQRLVDRLKRVRAMLCPARASSGSSNKQRRYRKAREMVDKEFHRAADKAAPDGHNHHEIQSFLQ